MRRLDLQTLRAVLGDHLRALPDEHVEGASGLAVHSDHVRPGDAFVALAGARGHGIDHAAAALAAGAAFVLSDRPHPRAVLVRDAADALRRLAGHARDQRRGPVVGVTGSVGKTTTKALLGAALEARTSPGNINTPPALAGVLVAAWLHDPPERPLVIELGIDHRGEMARLLDLVRPSHGVLTAIAPAHLSGLGSLDDVAREKSALLRAAPRGRYAGPSAWAHLDEPARANTLCVGLGPGLPGGHHDFAGRRLAARLRGPQGDPVTVDLRLPGIGAPVAHAALLALQVALDLGVEPRVAARRVATAQLEPHRLELHALATLTLLDDSYNASPASARAALEVLAELPAPRAAVLGDMRELGALSATAHAELGRSLRASGVERVWFVGPESRAAFTASDVPERHHVDDVDALLALDLPRRGSLLVKGSRSVGLERVVAALLAAMRQPVAS
jgi:UDP-N-acetylmuramoyl-tripeptide--D-alanyl-D-alanine ligase